MPSLIFFCDRARNQRTHIAVPRLVADLPTFGQIEDWIVENRITVRADRTILLIDDEPAGLELRGRVLQDIGYKVLSARTGAEGLALFQAHDVDVVVTDHLAGSAPGIALSMKRLKPHVSIVSFSGSAEPEQTRSYADVCIRKGEGPQALIGAIDQIVTG